MLAERLARLGVRSASDLLFVLPLRYEDRTRIVPIGALLAGSRAVVEGEVLLAEVVFRRRRQLLCGSVTGAARSRCASFTSQTHSAQGWHAARGSVATAKCAADPWGSRWCIRNTAASAPSVRSSSKP